MINKKVTLLLILILAFFVRYYNSGGNSVFYFDESYDALQARRMIVDKKITLLGHPYSISGTYQGPLYYYLTAPYLALSNYNPESVVYFISFINVLVLVVIWFFSKKYLGLKAAFFASLLFALSPKLVELSQKSWYPGPIELFSPLAFFLLVLSKEKQKVLFTFLSGILAGFMLQLHIMSFPFVIFTTLFLLFSKRGHFLVVFFLGAVLGVSPMIIFELRHEFFNLNLFWKYLNSNLGNQPYPSYLERIYLTLKTLLGGYFGGDQNVTILIATAIATLFGGFLLYKKNKKIARLLIIYIFFGVILTSIFKGDMTFHYLTFLHFVPVVFIGYFLAYFSKHRIVQVALVPCFLIILYLFASGKFNVVSEWTIEKSRIAGKLIAKDVGKNEKFNVVLLVHGESRAWPLRYFLDVYDRTPLGVDDYGRSKIIYVVSDDLNLVKTINLWELRAGGPLKVTKEWKIDSENYLYKLNYINL